MGGQRRRRGVRAVAMAVTAMVAAGLGAGQARAQTDYDVGVRESSRVTLCGTDLFGGPGIVADGVHANVLVPIRPAPPRVGEVFRVAAAIGAVGDSCVAQLAYVELVPPVGVELAVSAQEPIRCLRIETAGGPEVPLEGCPQSGAPGVRGVQLARTTALPGGLWDLPLGQLLVLEVPLRASRPLAGLAGGGPSCGRSGVSPLNPGGAMPCPPERAGDAVQLGVAVVDGQGSPWLAPYNPLTVVGGPVTGPPTAPRPPSGPVTPAAPGPEAESGPATAPPVLVSRPARVRMRQALRRGVRVRVRVHGDGARVTARLRARGLRGVPGGTIARVVRRGAAAGELRLRLRPTRRAARALRGRARVTATLSVTVAVPGAPARRASTRIRLRR